MAGPLASGGNILSRDGAPFSDVNGTNCCCAEGCDACPTDCDACDCSYTIEVSDIDMTCNAACTGTVSCTFYRGFHSSNEPPPCDPDEYGCFWEPKYLWFVDPTQCDESGSIVFCGAGDNDINGRLVPDLRCVVDAGVAYWELYVALGCTEISGCFTAIDGCWNAHDAYAIWRVPVANSPCGSDCPPTTGWVLYETGGLDSDPTLSVSSA